MEIRQARSSDYDVVIGIVDEWWGGRHMRAILPRLFFEHFDVTSFVVQDEGKVIGFLCGFLSQSFAREAYIHFVGIHPEYRKRDVGRQLYEKFFAVATSHGRDTVRCVTSPVNKTSIAFHARLGFEIEPGDGTLEGVPIHRDYDGPGEDRVLFVKRI
jgi:ribosomal protein S18 acetylase RimI-like enzyme